MAVILKNRGIGILHYFVDIGILYAIIDVFVFTLGGVAGRDSAIFK